MCAIRRYLSFGSSELMFATEIIASPEVRVRVSGSAFRPPVPSTGSRMSQLNTKEMTKIMMKERRKLIYLQRNVTRQSRD